MKAHLLIGLVLIGVSSCCIFSDRSMLGNKWPTPLASKQDIEAAKPDIHAAYIQHLRIQDYPLLSKFSELEAVVFDNIEGTLANNDKLRALASIELPHLRAISMNNCRLITDSGIQWLTKISSLRSLVLEGTDITDSSCASISREMQLTGLNVANCAKLSLVGLKILVASGTLEEFSFSANTLTQQETVDLVRSFKNVKWCNIVDPTHKLDSNSVETEGAKRGIRINVRATGSLQDKFGTPD